jgi:hypothetical protein
MIVHAWCGFLAWHQHNPSCCPSLPTLRICIMRPISRAEAALLLLAAAGAAPAAPPAAAPAPAPAVPAPAAAAAILLFIATRSCRVKFLRRAAYSCAWRLLSAQRSVTCGLHTRPKDKGRQQVEP